MKLKLVATIVTLTVAGIASQVAMAAGIPDGHVNFIGKIAATTCTNSTGNNVNLGTLALSDPTMANPGDRGADNRFYLELRNCDASTLKSAVVRFNGQADPFDSSAVKIDVGVGKGQGVAIVIVDTDGSAVLNGYSRPYELVNGINKLPFDAHLVRTTAKEKPMVAGDISAIAEFNITYK